MSRSAQAPYRLARSYLVRDSDERKLFHELESSHARHFHLTINHRNDDHFDPATNTIAWDPYSALRTTDGGRQSPALGLAHEIDHAVERARIAARLSATPSRQYDSAEERRVITGSERHAARTLGEDTRSDHGGATYRVASPVER